MYITFAVFPKFSGTINTKIVLKMKGIILTTNHGRAWPHFVLVLSIIPPIAISDMASKSLAINSIVPTTDAAIPTLSV